MLEMNVYFRQQSKIKYFEHQRKTMIILNCEIKNLQKSTK